ncbi:universal stress protein [Brevibacillus brevis]|uniref:Universal stress protein n=1 Tax=Brevibacillus brevis TaxID=1393 RepID=A0ABY9T3Y7_BREBE|nr:universal stress protein [Brevibacillus brevis]WNC14628.1 universal stress protein [Brevibacillus brevis]
MLCSKILVPYDGSALAKKALEKAVKLAQTDPAIEIVVAHVVTIPALPDPAVTVIQTLEEHIFKEGEAVLAEAKEALAGLPNRTEAILLEGHPAPVILKLANESGSDLIIMGNRGLSGLREFLGSVSHSVVHHSPIPVLLVK